MKSGQILILVLLIVVVALAVGLSVASRNIVNLRTSTQTKESQRAFGTAEGGIEDVLSRLSTLKTDAAVASATGKDLTVSVGDLQASVNVKGSKVYESKVELGEVGQIDLTGFAGSQVEVHWAKGAVENGGDGPASLEIGGIYIGTPYGMYRGYFAGQAGRANEILGSNPAQFSSCPEPGDGYHKCAQVAVPVGTGVALRVKPFWASTTVKVFSTTAGLDLPVQTYDISSSATSTVGVTRAVQVKRTALPMMPAVFDYAMFSEGDIIK